MPNGYSVGNLELDITALDKSATSFKNVIDRLSTMLGLVQELSNAFRELAQINNFANGLAKIAKIDLKPVADNIQKIPEAVKPLVNLGAGFKGLGQLTNFANGLQKIAQVNTPDVYKKINSIVRTVTPLQGFGESFKGLGQLTNFANGLQKIVKLDVAGFDTQIKALTASLRPFLQEITVATPALTAFSTAMASLKGRRMIGFTQFDQSGGKTQNLAKTLNLAGVLGKLYFIRNYTKQLGQFMQGLVQSAIDYTETLNLWQVAMRGNIDTAEEFISKMNKAYGIAEQTLMKYQATFRNMLSTLGGVSTDVSYALSEYLTQMALDYASLYNTSIDKAMTVFQSVLSGQVRPIRSISGYDITETTIFQLYQQLGGTKTMRQLSQTEKRLLRIYAVFQQMDRSGAIGDLNKTLNNTANQMRIMSESAKELGVWIGKMIELYVAPALPYINAFLITAKNIAQAITKSLPNYSEFDGTIKGYEETAEAMDEVQGKLLDFDKFRSLSGAEENNLGLGIDENLITGLTQYQSILSNVSNKATELAEKWTAWWINNETGKFTPQAEKLLAVLKAISVVVTSLIVIGIGRKIGKFGKSLIGITETLKGLKSLVSFLVSPLGIILTIFGYLFVTNERFRDSILKLVNTIAEPLSNLLSVTIDGVGALLNVIFPAIQLIGDLTASLIDFLDEAGLLEPLLYGVLIAVASFKISKWANNISSLVLHLLNATKSISGMQIAISACAGALGFLLGDMLLSNLGEQARSIVAPIMLAVGAVGALVTAILALQGVMSWGTALPVLMASIGVAVAGAKSMLSTDNLQVRKNGGLVEDGLFTMNKGEVMGTFDDGTSIVANNQQIISGIKQGVYQAVSQAMANSGRTDDRPIDIYIDGEKVFQATKKNAKRHGYAFAKV